MVSNSAISLIIAVVSLIGTLVVAAFSAWKQQSLENLKHSREVDKEVKKYSGPLAVAAWELQERLFDIVDTDISKLQLENEEGKKNVEGKQNLEVMSSFLLAQYLAWALILREKTQFLSFTGNSRWKRLRITMYKIDDELDRKVDRRQGIYANWPACRLSVSERAIVKTDGTEGGDNVLRSMRWDEFNKSWESDFESLLAWYIRQIIVNTVLKKANNEKPLDERLRRLQHLLMDLVSMLDAEGLIQDDRPSTGQKCKPARWCDCDWKECKPGPTPWSESEGRTRRERHDKFYDKPKQVSATTGREQLTGAYDGEGKAHDAIYSREKASQQV